MVVSDIGIASTKNEGKSILSETFIRTLERQFSCYMTPISKHVYTDSILILIIKTKPDNVVPETC